MAMDLCSGSTGHHGLILPEESHFLLDCQMDSLLLDQSSDAGYHSGSSLSPTSSVDSCCLSPPAAAPLFGGDALGCFSEIPECFSFQPAVPRSSGATVTATAAAMAVAEEEEQEEEESRVPRQRGRKSRSKYPGRKRQSASEREKLRMRDLTKALQHLRTYLPASVAPVGQTLTKIETLRLTIRYIAHLSDQLGLNDQELGLNDQELAQSGSPSVPCLSYGQQAQSFDPQFSSSMAQQPQALPQPLPQAYSPALGTFPAHAPLQTSSLMDPGFPSQTLPQPLHGSYQNPNGVTYAQDFCFTPQELWVPPQQNMFYGLC